MASRKLLGGVRRGHEERDEELELGAGKILGEKVGDHIFGRDVVQLEVSEGDTLVEVMPLNIDVFCAFCMP